MERETHTIDAEGEKLGRMASQIAKLLRGKHKPTFNPREDRGDFVEVENIGNMEVSGKKLEQKSYYYHTGHPGGIKEEQMKELMEEDPGEVLKRAVKGMLPDNKLREDQMKRLTIK
ncbi:MAG: 50S ribosomal protein L13 [Candidatus Paceibacterota bacterium]